MLTRSVVVVGGGGGVGVFVSEKESPIFSSNFKLSLTCPPSLSSTTTKELMRS